MAGDKSVAKFFAVLIVIGLVVMAVGTALAFIGHAGQSAQKPQDRGRSVIKIGIVTWPGFAPCFIGKERHFFEDLDIEIKIIDDMTARDAAFRSGELDILATSADVWVQEHAQGLEGQVILVSDQSFGADGVVVSENIRTISELRGKRVAFARATPSHYLLFKVLQDAKLTPDDIEQVKVEDSSNAGQAFIGGSVEAAVTWEPFISTVRKSGKGKVLVTTRDYPGYIVDLLVASPKLLKNKEVLNKFMRGWLRSVDYMIEHPQLARQPIAQGFQMDIKDVDMMMSGLRLAPAAMNRHYLLADAQGHFALEAVLLDAAKFWKRQGIIATLPGTQSLVSPAFTAFSQGSDSQGESADYKTLSQSGKKRMELFAGLLFSGLYVFLFWRVIVCNNLTGALTFSSGKSGKSKNLLRLMYWLAPVLVVALWCTCSAVNLLPDKFVPAPGAVLIAFYKLLVSGTLLLESWISLTRVLIGFTAAAAIGVPLGLFAGTFLIGRQLITPINSFFRYIPPTAFISLLILYCGVGEIFKYTVIFIGGIFFIIQMIIDIVEDLDVSYIEMAVTSGMSNWNIFQRVVLPWSGPRIIDVLRINLSAAWTFLVVAELIGAEQGLGHFIALSQRFLRLDDLFVGIIMFGLIGLITDICLQKLGEVMFTWHNLSLKRSAGD